MLKISPMHELFLYNSLTRQKEKFLPLHPEKVGLYVCGPTVYGEAHLGHARSAIAFDIVYRYLQEIGYKVRYVRNITDVGHLSDELGEGEDKIAKQAKIEQLEPMEVVQQYTNAYRENMQRLGVLSPSIEPQASGHIIEQIALVKDILDKGFAYEVNGSVYFDVEHYNASHPDEKYGLLSGRKIEDLLETTRELNNQGEKRKPYDFALWKKAERGHLMRWHSPWGMGYPGWHLECSAMSVKYLGQQFDIHGGGLDLAFPHHECEIAQSRVSQKQHVVKYWMHNNMITIGGQKMGKSLNNFITLEEFFSGNHEYLSQAFSPMIIRLFTLQAHYRSTLDFSNDALLATQKGYQKLCKSYAALGTLPLNKTSTAGLDTLQDSCYQAMNDDFNTPILLSHIFGLCKSINQAVQGKTKFTAEDVRLAKQVFDIFVVSIMGITLETATTTGNTDRAAALVELLLHYRKEAKQQKEFAKSDEIRDKLIALGVQIKDTRDGVEWSFEN